MDEPNRDRPFYSIKLIPAGGASESLDLSEKVIAFEFEDAEKKADKLTLKIDNWDLTEFDSPTWRKGGIIEFVYGYPGKVSPPRRCVIQKVKGNQILTVEAHALSMLMHKIKKSRVWANSTLGEIARKIAGEYGSDLGVPNGTIGDNIKIDAELDKKVPHRVQAAQSDAEFLAKLARRYGLEFYVDASGMHFKRRNMHQTPIKTLTWYIDGNGEIQAFDIENDLTRKAGSHTLKSLDPLTKKQLKHTADNETKREGLAPVAEIAEVDERTGTINRHPISDISVGHTSETAIHGVKHKAIGDYLQTQHTTVHLTADLIGDPDISGKRVVEIRGLGKRVSGKYYIQTATHEITSAGYKTKIKAKTDGHGGYGNNNVKSKSSQNKQAPSEDVILKIDKRTGNQRYTKRGDE